MFLIYSNKINDLNSNVCPQVENLYLKSQIVSINVDENVCWIDGQMCILCTAVGEMKDVFDIPESKQTVTDTLLYRLIQHVYFVTSASFMVRWVVVSIPHDGPNKLFLVPVSAPKLVCQKLWYVLSCLGWCTL